MYAGSWGSAPNPVHEGVWGGSPQAGIGTEPQPNRRRPPGSPPDYATDCLEEAIIVKEEGEKIAIPVAEARQSTIPDFVWDVAETCCRDGCEYQMLKSLCCE